MTAGGTAGGGVGGEGGSGDAGLLLHMHIKHTMQSLPWAQGHYAGSGRSGDAYLLGAAGDSMSNKCDGNGRGDRPAAWWPAPDDAPSGVHMDMEEGTPPRLPGAKSAKDAQAGPVDTVGVPKAPMDEGGVSRVSCGRAGTRRGRVWALAAALQGRGGTHAATGMCTRHRFSPLGSPHPQPPASALTRWQGEAL